MDVLLAKVTQQAMNYAIRSGITITASYAIRQSSRLLKSVNGSEREELQTLQERLESKIRIISPAIDMIELISARGNTSLESAVSLTQSLRWEIQALGQRLATAANQEDLARNGSSKARSKAHHELELKAIANQIRKLLTQIEDAVPFINLAITTSGASLSTRLPTTVSPSRLLQASTFLTAGDTQYAMAPRGSVQIGPTFTLSMYMLFSGHLRPKSEEDVRQSTWKEIIHKARLKMIRVPVDSLYNLPRQATQPSFGSSTSSNGFSSPYGSNQFPSHIEAEGRADEFSYQIIVIEDLNDDRVHTYEDDEAQPGPYDDVELAGIREAIPIHQISKIFYADTGKILNIGDNGEANTPVLLLKRDINAVPPRRMMESSNEIQTLDSLQATDIRSLAHLSDQEENSQALLDAQFERENRSASLFPVVCAEPVLSSHSWRIPSNLDPEWLAFEVYTEPADSDTESEADTTSTRYSKSPRATSVDPPITTVLANLHLNGISTPTTGHHQQAIKSKPSVSTIPTIRTSLSLLETLLRLLSLQQFQQTSHLSIPDELLNFFLSEAATTGAASGDEQERRRLRNDARRRVGFDPYDESPIKRRGENYQYRGGESQAGWHDGQNGYAEEHDGSRNGADYSPREQHYEGYHDPRWDEGYDTHGVYTPSLHPNYTNNRASTPADTPPLLLNNRSYSNTPDRSMPPLSRSSGSGNVNGMFPSPSTPSGGLSGVGRGGRGARTRIEEDLRAQRRGSPLGRPGTGITDEGLGTSPVVMESTEKY